LAVGPKPTTPAKPAAAPVDAKVLQYAMFLRGRIFAAKEEWSKSREAFEQLLLTHPESPRRLPAEFWVAESYYRQNDFSAAADRFKRLADATRGAHESWVAMIPLRRAQIFARQNQWDDAYAIAAKIADEHPQFEQQYEVDYLLGRCLANRADFEAARQAYGRAIHSPSGDKTETAAMAQWMIGETFFHQKNYQAALKAYMDLEILYAYPTWQSVALLQAGKCRERLGDKPAAAELYQKVLKTYSDTAAAKEASKLLANLQSTNR
jgi:cellulose synthase operon protein C